jgi:hypothetical protein
LVKLYEVGVVYKEDNDSHRESELLVFKDDAEAEDYIRRGAIKALFTLAPFEKLATIAADYFSKTAEEITSEMIDGLAGEDTQKVFDALKEITENPTVEKYYIEEVSFFEDASGNKYPIEIMESKPEKATKKSKTSKN